MTEEQIKVVKESDEPEQAAMVYVEKGEATIIEFTHEHLMGRCGKKKEYLERGSAEDVGGWDIVADSVRWEDFADDLLCGGSIIIPGTMKDEAVTSFIDQMQNMVALIIANEHQEENFNDEE